MILDLYAGGPSGWSTALAALGEKALGLEYDAQACATRAAIGHSTLRCDIGSYPIRPFFDKVVGLTASPPCQTFSTSGKGEGRKHLDRLVEQVLDMDWSPAELDDRTAHVLHTGRWVSALMPEWVCFEQVRGVQPVWDAYAEVMSGWGYSVWTGKLCAADFGTPQTRTRAMFVASRVREVSAPDPTHAKDGAGGLEPWVSMADALGRGYTESPCHTITAGGTETGGADPFLTGGSAARRKVREAQLIPGSWADGRGGNRRTYGADEPAPTLQFGKDSGGWKWMGPEWCPSRPATTVTTDRRPSPPGYHDPAIPNTQNGPGMHRMEPWEALVLQDFPADYPIQGSMTSQFRQIGNAIPVRLAIACVQAATGWAIDSEEAA